MSEFVIVQRLPRPPLYAHTPLFRSLAAAGNDARPSDDAGNDHGLAMLVPLAAGHVLHVSAPCPIASGFASKALARLYP